MMKLLVITWSLQMIHILISGRSFERPTGYPPLPERYFDPNDCNQYRQQCSEKDQIILVIDRCNWETISSLCNVSSGPYCGDIKTVHPTVGTVVGAEHRVWKCTNVHLTEIRQRMLRRTNELRARHGAQPLHEDDYINGVVQRIAEQWANYGPSPYDGCGQTSQSYEVSPTSNLVPEDFVDDWYSEMRNWNFERSKCNNGLAREFAALVWKSSRIVGYGVAPDASCKSVYFVVCYTPILGKADQNVGRLINQPPGRWTTPRRLNTPAPPPDRWTTPRRLNTPAPPPTVITAASPRAEETTTPSPPEKTTAQPHVINPDTPDLGPPHQVISADRGPD